MKSGWTTRTLGEVCQFRGGGTPSKAVERYWRGDIPWVSPKDMKFDVVSDSIDHISQEAIDGSATSLIPKDSVLIVVRSGILARTVPIAITGRALTINQDLKALCPNGAVDARFLYHLLGSKLDVLLSMVTRGATVHRLMTEQVRSLDFILPPLPEQQRIVGILDEAFEGIATAKTNAERNLQNTCALFESHLQSVFTHRGEGWVEKPLNEIGTTQTGSTPKTSERDNYGDFIPFVKPADFDADGSLDYENDGLTEKGLSKARKVAAGSALMVCIGATIGKCGYSDRDITTNQQINALTPFKGVSNKFVYYQMLTESFQRRVMLSSGQATLPIINKSKWNALTLALPPTLEEQKRIVAKFDSLCEETQRLASVYERKLAALEELKKSLLHQAFTGQL